MATETPTDSELKTAQVLFLDVVGYSKLLSDKQRELFHLLNELVRNTAQFRAAEAAGKLVRLPTGDGMVLAFFTSIDAPVRCAQEIGCKLREYPQLALRMGINSGPVDEVRDVNNRPNVTGAGINLAQRVMDCGDAGHILLSKRVADDLAQYSEWQSNLHDLGEVEIKHGARVGLTNFFGNGFGNSKPPAKIIRAKQARRRRLFLSAVAILLLLVCVTIGAWIWTRRGALTTAYKVAAAGISEKSIAVLPLENLTEEKENAYFADGIQEELLSDLAKIRNLKVISRTSVMQYKSGIARNLKEIAQQLGVSKVVEGSVRRSGNHIRVSVQLIDAFTDRHIWSENYDRTLADSLNLEGELATEIAAGVGATLTPQEKARVETQPTKNPNAYDAYLRGRAIGARASTNKSEIEGAIKSYQEAVKFDPNFVLAWAYLSSMQSLEYWSGGDPTPARLAAAKEALDRAIALDPNLPETHLALGYYRYYGQRDFAGALAEFQIAEQGFPNNADILKAIALIHRRLGHWDETIVAARRLVELDPRNTASTKMLAVTYMSVHHYSDALAMADHILAVEPANADAIGIKLFCFWATGNLEAADALVANPNVDPGLRGSNALARRRYSEAAHILAKILNDHPDAEKDLFIQLGLAQQGVGNVEGAKATYQHAAEELQRQLGKAVPDSGAAADLHSNLGIAYAGLGDAASAVAEGEKGIALQPSSQDPFEGPLREEDMAVIYALLGDADHAIPILRRLVAISSSTSITPTLLRLDPIWDPIRNDPRFQQLLAGKEQIGPNK